MYGLQSAKVEEVRGTMDLDRTPSGLPTEVHSAIVEECLTPVGKERSGRGEGGKREKREEVGGEGGKREKRKWEGEEKGVTKT